MVEKIGIALYGRIGIERCFCEKCKTMSLIINEEKQCCGEKTEVIPLEVYKMSENYHPRKLIATKETTKKIMKEQNNLCLYCGNPFGYLYFRDGKIIKSSIHLDHFSPFSYSLDNRKRNLVASCNLCNMLKSNKTFNSLEQIKEYINEKREQKRIEILC